MKDKKQKRPEDPIRILSDFAFSEWLKQLTPEDRDERAIERFCKATGATKNSPFVMMYEAFYNGFCKGLDMALAMEDQEGQGAGI